MESREAVGRRTGTTVAVSGLAARTRVSVSFALGAATEGGVRSGGNGRSVPPLVPGRLGDGDVRGLARTVESDAGIESGLTTVPALVVSGPDGAGLGASEARVPSTT